MTKIHKKKLILIVKMPTDVTGFKACNKKPVKKVKLRAKHYKLRKHCEVNQIFDLSIDSNKIGKPQLGGK
jgi:hypothetical protein